MNCKEDLLEVVRALEEKLKYNILAWVLMLAAFVYTLIRAHSLSIISDEAETYLISLGSFLDILTYRFATANNHLLNTLLIKIFTRLLGLSEFVVRIPALLGHSLYLVGVYKILKTFLREKLFLAGICLLLFNPFMLELFSGARGYALGLGFLTFSIYYFLMSIKDVPANSSKRNRTWATWMLALATLSNLAFLNVYLSLLTLLVGYELIELCPLIKQKQKEAREQKKSFKLGLKHFFKKIAPLLIPSLFLLAIYIWPIYKMIKLDQFHYGGKRGFWIDTVTSLIKSSLYGKAYHNFHLVWLMNILIVIVLLVAAAWLLYKLFTKREFKLIDRYLLGMMALLLTCSFVVILQWHLLNTRYVMGRTAIYFIPMFLIVFLIMGGEGSRVKNKLIKVATQGFFCFFVLISLVHFYNCANFSYYYYWPWDASTKAIMNYLAEENQGRGLADNSVSIGNYRDFTRSINFYKEKNKLSWLKWAGWGGPDGKFDYYLLSKKRSIFGKSRITENLRLIKKYNLRIIKEFDWGSFLASPEKQGKEQKVTSRVKPLSDDAKMKGKRFKVRFVARQLTWIKIAIDNKYPLELMMRAGESFWMAATESMKVRIENAEGFSLFFNDLPLRVPERHGKPLDLQFPEVVKELKSF